MKSLIIATALIASVLASAVSANAQSVTNGGFDAAQFFMEQATRTDG